MDAKYFATISAEDGSVWLLICNSNTMLKEILKIDTPAYIGNTAVTVADRIWACYYAINGNDGGIKLRSFDRFSGLAESTDADIQILPVTEMDWNKDYNFNSRRNEIRPAIAAAPASKSVIFCVNWLDTLKGNNNRPFRGLVGMCDPYNDNAIYRGKCFYQTTSRDIDGSRNQADYSYISPAIAISKVKTTTKYQDMLHIVCPDIL